MKTIEEKAKAYDKVRKKIAIRFGSNVADEFFAEFEGSKDEEIRKALLEMVHDTTGDELWACYNVHKEETLAWLENQGQVKESAISQHEIETCKENGNSLTSEDAIEREVKEDAGGYPYIDATELYDYENDKPLAKAGDRVKVVFIKDK